MTPSRRDSDLVRPYVVTGGRAHPRIPFDLVSLVVAAGDPPPGGPDLGPEKRRLMALCRGGALSVAEVAAHLALPVGVTKVLLGDLTESGHLATRAPAPPAERPDVQLLQEVLDGLRALV
ncbi:hypothetical protein FHS43_002864 [Streptosporangium becharense]|uniref:DUF742 domain-containing protein n=1 Tax=Streptosporangium becharense TaxID=1816182 RepID=A0A7W9ILM5_9ACTN|nr:DUF742 domain-containing protein [Streptosporangium becharense]MBB2911591.1 hypothetical protein [Streptosporangium becharense]MBB5822591.1 hypothetical protein [Streptosporangium becharense]